MRPQNTVPYLIRSAIVALLAIIAVGLAGPAGVGPTPQSAEAVSALELKKLVASDGAASDFFGSRAAVSGDTALVGAHGGEAAYIFQRDQGGADNWGEVKKLTASDAGGNDHFGVSVALSGDIAVVGAWRNNPGPLLGDAGAAYIFQRDAGGANNWGEVKRLTASDLEYADHLGRSVAVSGDTAVIGATGEDAGGNAAGAAYVFQRDQGGVDNWGEVKKLIASDAGDFDQFGWSVAVSGGTAMVGAYQEDAGGANAGAAYVFQRDQGGADNWGELKKLTVSDAAAGDHFGVSVALSGGTAIVGANLEDIAGTLLDNFGAAYVFQRDVGGADNWGEVTKLTASDAEAFDAFGFSVSVSGDTAIVGTEFENATAGAAYLFDRDEGGADNWGEVTKLTASDAQTNDHFGVSVAVSDGTAVVGAYLEGSEGIQPGAAYVFEQLGPGDTDQDGCTDKAEFGADPALGGLRDSNSFWDFYDVWTHPIANPLAWERDRAVVVSDILAVAARFGPAPGGPQSKVDALAAALIPPVDETGYHAAFDRGVQIGTDDWDRAPPDGVITITEDILGVAAQFGHDCS